MKYIENDLDGSAPYQSASLTIKNVPNAQTKYIEVILVKKNAIRNKYPLVALLIDKYKSIILKDPIYLFKLNGLLYVQIDKL